jgi:hypothetical protein
MNGNSGSAGVEWSADVWQATADAVTQEAPKIRIGQKVFPTTMPDGDPTELQDEAIVLRNLSIREGHTKRFVEIYQARLSLAARNRPALDPNLAFADLPPDGQAPAFDLVVHAISCRRTSGRWPRHGCREARRLRGVQCDGQPGGRAARRSGG